MIWQTWVRIIELHCVNYLFDDDVGIRLTGRKSAFYSMKQAWKLGLLAYKSLGCPLAVHQPGDFFLSQFRPNPVGARAWVGGPRKKKRVGNLPRTGRAIWHAIDRQSDVKQ